MASGRSLQVEVVSHEGRLWHGAALSVQIPTVDGSWVFSRAASHCSPSWATAP